MAAEPDNAPATGASGRPVPPVPSVSTVPAPAVDTGYTPDGVPTLEGVRERIETRLGTALGATELAEDSPEAHAAAERYEARQQAAGDRLEQIRASMRETPTD